MTTIVGETDAGKSAIIRALRWVLLNAAPKDFITWGADLCRVTLWVDGHRVQRERDARNNIYRLDDQEYRSFNTDVPDPIANLLNVDEATIQRQIEPPFWLTDTPGRVSRNLNTIVNLEIIDETLSQLLGRLRKARTTVEVSEERLAAARKTATRLRYARQLGEDLRAVEVLAENAALARGTAARVRAMVHTADMHAAIANDAQAYAQAGQAVVNLGAAARAAAGAWARCVAQRDTARKYQRLATVRVPSMKRLEELKQRASEASAAADRITALALRLRQAVRAVARAEEDLADATAELDKYKTTFKVCPVCERPIRK